MWRFLLAGLVTVCGLVLLFMASMGDPMTELHDARALLPVIQSPPRASAPQPVAVAAPVPASQPAIAPAPPAAPPSAQAPTAAPPAAPSAQALAAQEQREELEQAGQKQRGELGQRVKSLQEKLDQSAQDMSALHNEADTEKHDAEALRQQRAAEQAELDRLRSAPPPAPSPNPPLSQPQPAPATAQTQPPPRTVDLAKSLSPDKRPSLPVSKPAPAQQGRPAPDFAAAEAVLTRLRHAPPSNTAPAVATDERSQPSASPGARLSDARRALRTGRIDEARGLLEQAQVQLVFRPVSPSGDMAPTGSVAAGEVAEALSMLNSGDIPDAERYINLAMGQSASVMQPVIADERSPYQETLSRP